MLSDRQERLLNFVVKEYLTTSNPVGSLQLKESAKLHVSPATVRNDLQELTKLGFIEQPHTSAGRIPTQKAYKYIAQRIQEEEERQLEEFIMRQVRQAHDEMAKEMKMMRELMDTLENDNFFDIFNILDKWHKR